MGSLEKVTTDEAIRKWAEDVRSGSTPTSRSPSCSSRRSTGWRSTSPTRTACSCAGPPAGTAIEGEDVTVNLRTISAIPLRMLGEDAAGAARGPRRGLHAALRLPRAERASSSRAGKKGAEPAQRGRRLAAAEGLRRSPPSAAPSWVYGIGRRDGLELESHWETLAWLREHGFRTNPFAERLDSIEEVAEACATGSTAA